MAGVKKCDPKCRDFTCNKRALRVRSGKAYCEWAQEECNPLNCTYAICRKRQLLENGDCGLTIKRRTRDSRGPEDFAMDDDIKLRGKAFKKTKKRDIY